MWWAKVVLAVALTGLTRALTAHCVADESVKLPLPRSSSGAGALAMAMAPT